MAVTPERFAQGLTYADYKAQMTRNQEQFEKNECAIELAPGDRAFFEGLDRRLNVLVIAEDWCGDVINNLPVLGRIAETSDQIDVRVFLRDQNLDIMDQYLKNGEFRSIPVFVVFDEEWNEIGFFSERPDSVTERNAAFLADLYANDPVMSKYDPATPVGELLDDVRQYLQQARGRFRDENRGFANQEVVREVRALFAKAVQGTEGEHADAGSAQFAAAPSAIAQTVDVRITYCAECGYEPQTLALTGDLMREFVHGLGSITLIPWHDGAFDVVVGGELVHSMYRDGGFPPSDRIIAAVRSRLGT